MTSKELSAEARELLRKWCPRAVSIEDFDSSPVRSSFATMIACKERTLAGRTYKQLGLAPLKLAYQDEAFTTGCLYVRGSLADVRSAIVAAYARHGLAALPRVESAKFRKPKAHATPRTEWLDDVVVVQEVDDGFVAVGSREWELAYPGANTLAVELSRTAPVLSLTSGPSFDEISVYRGGALAHAWVPRGKRTYRAKSVSQPLSIDLLETTFGALARWEDLTGLLEAAEEAEHEEDAVGVEELMMSFEHQGFTNEIEGIFDTYAHGPPVVIPELMGFARATSRSKVTAKVTAKPTKGAAPTVAGSTVVLAIVSKAMFEKQHPGAKVGDVLPIDRYSSTNPALAKAGSGGSLVLVTVRPGDTLWLVAILDAPRHVDGEWIASASSVPMTNLTNRLDSIRFASGAILAAAPGKLGMALQTPRALAAGVVDALRTSSKKRSR